MDGFKLTILIPAYCEASTIGKIVSAAKEYAPVIVVDDCSSDDTGVIAELAGATVLRNPFNMGYEKTLNRGFEHVASLGYDAVITMDADGEHDPETIAEFIDELIGKNIPLVLGFRPSKARVSEIIMGAYIRWRFGVYDILCGMKGYHMSLWQKNGGFDLSNSIGTELAINSLRCGTDFSQIPVNGVKRLDTPRFGHSLQANLKIFVALSRILRSA